MPLSSIKNTGCGRASTFLSGNDHLAQVAGIPGPSPPAKVGEPGMAIKDGLCAFNGIAPVGILSRKGGRISKRKKKGGPHMNA
jgi:hypothetical protein